MPSLRYPLLYQLNTRLYLTELSEKLGRKSKINDIPDEFLQGLVDLGFNWIWLLGIWQTGTASREVSRSNHQWKVEYESTLSDLEEKDICGSCFAIKDYKVHKDLGGESSYLEFRRRAKKFGLKIMLDFVPNHMALDHPWVESNPEFFIVRSENELKNDPNNHVELKSRSGNRVFAYGRDPYFEGWPDTVQLDYSNPELFQKMKETLLNISAICDGVRCDMAMLLEPDIFQKTWGVRSQPYWKEAIFEVKMQNPDFIFMAEVYWDMEWGLQQQGFDFTYDKRLYDRLVAKNAREVYLHLHADIDYMSKMVHFLENHDEQRANWVFNFDQHKAAAIINYLIPGLRFFYQNQIEGFKKKITPHLCRGPKEQIDENLQQFYLELLALMKKEIFMRGQWNCEKIDSAGDITFNNLIAFSWKYLSQTYLIIVNYSEWESQGFVDVNTIKLDSDTVFFQDETNGKEYAWDRILIIEQGLYIQLKPWKYHLFRVENNKT